jgi:serine/threonine-protein kinase
VSERGAGWLEPGTLVAGQFRVLRYLARGGMGLIYEAEGAGGRVAIKTVAAAVGDEEARVRFEREAEAMSRLTHAGIVGVHAFGRLPDSAYFMVMEYVNGVPLSKVLEHGALPPGQTAGMLRQLLFALSYAHAMGVIHRDLKPDNIMVEPDGRTRMIDFGIAKLLDDVGGGKLTRPGMVFGTPFYLSPEQATGRPCDGRADQYAAGVILFQMLTGRVPFWGDDIATMLRAHALQPAPSLAEATGATFAPALEAVVARALAKRPDDRYPDIRLMALALDAATHAR